MAENENNLGGRVGLDTTDFKAGISDLNRQIRIIDSGFRAAAAGLGDWGNSADGLKKRIDALNQITELQRKKVSGLTEQYKKVAAEKGADSKAAQDLQVKLNRETEALNKNQLELKQNTTALDKMGNETEDTSAKTSKLTGVLGKMGTGLKKAGVTIAKTAVAGIAAVGTAAVAAAAGALKLASNTGKAADELITLSNKTGISTKQLQEMQYAARFIDVEVETMTGSMVKLTRSMDSARDGGKDATAAFAQLGVSITNQDGSLRNSKEVWTEVIDSLGTISNETERDALAMELFGKSAQELNPLIKAGSEELARLSAEANEVGAVMSDEAVVAAGKFDDIMQTLQASAKGLASTVGVAVMPALTGFISIITDMIPSLNKSIQDGDWESAGTNISGALNAILTQVTGMLPGLATMASTIIGGLAGALVIAIPAVVPAITDATVALIATLVQIIVTNGPTLAAAGMTALLTLIQGILGALPSLMDAALQIIATLAGLIVENGPTLIATGVTTLIALIEGIVGALPSLLDTAISIILMLVDGILGAIPQLIPVAIKAIITLAQGIINALPRLIEKAPEIIRTLVKAIVENLPLLISAAIQIVTTLVKAIVENLPLILTAAIDIIAALAEGIISAFPELVKTIPKLYKAIFDALKGIDWSTLGKNIIDGIKSGIGSAATGLADSVKTAASSALSGVKKLLDINSPSGVFERQVGVQIPAGIARGIDKSASKVNAALNKINTDITTDVNTNFNGLGNSKNGSSYGGNSITVNVPLNMDGRVMTAATGKIQLGYNRSRSRALGVVTA